MIISIGCDHSGFELKDAMLPLLKSAGHEVIDHGSYHEREKPFFVDISKLVCAPILEGKADRGIIFTGAGIGPVIACNKIPGIRASIAHDVYTAHLAVEHDHVQILCMGGQIVGKSLAWSLIETFLGAVGNDDENTRIVLEKIANLDNSLAKR